LSRQGVVHGRPRWPPGFVSAVGMLFSFMTQTICSARFAINGAEPAAHVAIAFIFPFYASYELVVLCFCLFLFESGEADSFPL
jgi:hypothetical protein